MSEREPNQDRYCRNCGAELREGTSFCVSCGVPFTQVAGPSAPPPSEPPTSASFDSFVNAVREQFQGWRRRFSGSSSARATVQQISGRMINWFRNLQSVPKLVVVGLVLLIPLVLLSPVMRVVAVIVFAASLAVVIIRLFQRKSVAIWSVVGVSSFVLFFGFGALSSAIYGSDSQSPSYGNSENSGDSSSIVDDVQTGDARFEAYTLCHSYFPEDLAEEFGTSEEQTEIAYVVGDQLGDSKETKEAAYDGCITALEEEALNYLPATESNIIQLVQEDGMGEPPDEPASGDYYVSQGVDMSEVPETDFYGKPTDLDPDHWFLVEHCSTSGRLYTYQANPWTAELYQESSEFDLNGESVC